MAEATTPGMAPSAAAQPAGAAPPARPWAVVRRHGAGLALLGAYVVVVLLTFRDYGVTFDEEWHANYGERIISWYQTLFRDRSALDYGNLQYYGGLFDVLGQSAWRLLPLDMYDARHLVNALFGVAGAATAYLIGLRLGGRLTGFTAALFLILTPFYYGHAFHNPKDLPFAVLHLSALLALLHMVRALPAPAWRLTALFGIATGLAMAVRMGGILLFGYLGVAFAGWLATRPRAEWLAAVQRFAPRLLFATVAAWLAMLPWWPSAQVSPIGHPLRTLRELSAFPWNYNVRFEGRDILAADLPWYYIEKYALLTLPEFVLLGLIAAVVLAALGLVAHFSARAARAATASESDGYARAGAAGGPGAAGIMAYGVIVLSIVFPLVYADITRATVYDAQRHFLFIFPPVIVLAAAAVAHLLRGPRPAALATAVVVTAALGIAVADMIRLHPYQYLYFNRAVAGGLERAQTGYETDYWGAGYREAAEWVAVNYRTDDLERRLRVATCGNRAGTAHYLPRRAFEVVLLEAEPDIVLGAPRFGCDDRIDGPPVHTIGRAGAVFVRIREITDYARSKRTVMAEHAKGPGGTQ